MILVVRKPDAWVVSNETYVAELVVEWPADQKVLDGWLVGTGSPLHCVPLRVLMPALWQQSVTGKTVG